MVLFQVISPTANLALVSAQDAILLRQDGVYLALAPDALPACQLYISAQDAADRQINIAAGITSLDDQQWVALCLTANTVMLC
jgi:sulfur relay protein TusB/DsrH